MACRVPACQEVANWCKEHMTLTPFAITTSAHPMTMTIWNFVDKTYLQYFEYRNTSSSSAKISLHSTRPPTKIQVLLQDPIQTAIRSSNYLLPRYLTRNTHTFFQLPLQHTHPPKMSTEQSSTNLLPTADDELLTPLEQDILEEYERLSKNMKTVPPPSPPHLPNLYC